MRDYAEISKEVEARYACPHSKTILRNKPDKIGRPMIAHQCLRCGSKVGAYQPSSSYSKAEQQNLPIWDRELEKSYSSGKYKEMARLWQAEQDKEKADWRRRYEAHLQSAKWKALREKVIERAKGYCEGCGHNKATQAHHLSYERMGEEMLFDLVAVCDDCHLRIHLKEEPQCEADPDKDDPDNFPSGDESLPF
jgi:5-methylcytosine-specific restriction endonuclease McrA